MQKPNGHVAGGANQGQAAEHPAPRPATPLPATEMEARERIRDFQDEARRRANVGGASGIYGETIPGIGKLYVTCRKELVQRARGERVRKRWSYMLDGAAITEKTLYQKVALLRELGEEA